MRIGRPHRARQPLKALGAAAFWLVAVLATPGIAQESDVLRAVGNRNAEVLAQTRDTALALEVATAERAETARLASELESRMRTIERHTALYAPGREFAQLLVEQLRALPRPANFTAAHDARARSVEALSDASLRTERARGELRDLDAAVAARIAALPPEGQVQRQQLADALRASLEERRELLERLSGQQDKLAEALRESEQAARDFEHRVEAAHAELTRFLFWIPAPTSLRTVVDLPAALAWMIAPANWRAAGAAVRDEWARHPLWPVVAFTAAVLLLALRGRLKRALVALAPAAHFEQYGIHHTVAALGITLALALPGPLVLWTLGTLLVGAPDVQPFVHALGDALLTAAKLLGALSTFAWLFDRRGVAVLHFGWHEASLAHAARSLRRFTALFIPLALVAALNGLAHSPLANRDSLARMTFSLAMIALAVLFVRLFRSRSPLLQRLVAEAPHSWGVRLHAVWFVLLTAVPLAVAALAAAGYITAAGYFFGKMLVTVFLVLAAVILYGLMALWVQVQRARLAQTGRESAGRAPTERGKEAGSEAATPRPPSLDIAAIGKQTRSLLHLLITLLLLGGAWWIWSGALPALAAIDDYALWTFKETVDGKSVVHSLTIGRLFLTFVVAGVTAVLIRNVGALLDIVLLRRLEMRADATYAIKVMTRYALAAVGVLLASNLLGIAWNNVQWLIAALGVGLGFGLQEIVANFVSGLIVLAERPIRIGDVVTVGDVSGTVARIRARATAVVDFDNKEVIIPNKAFITERVVNWTLSNQTTRLLLKVGVAYGSDIALVQRIVMEVVRGNPDVLREPPPSVFFVNFGDNSLDFEIRAFVASLDKRLRVQHEIYAGVERVLREHGIGIPFPQRDVRIVSAPRLGAPQPDDRAG